MDDPESALERLRRLSQGRPAQGPPARQDAARQRGIIGTILVTIGLFLAKFGKVLLLLLGKLKFLLVGLKAISLSGFLTTLGSMGVSAWLYARYFGGWFALGFVLLVLVHELGHGSAARMMGLKVGAPVFIPFIGAFIAMKEQPRSTWVECMVGFAGPFAGMLGAAATLVAAVSIADPWWHTFLLSLAWFTFYINLFNLLPVFGLDGDRTSRPLRARHWMIGLLAVALAFAAGSEAGGRASAVLLIIGILVIGKAVQAWRREHGARRTLLDQVARPAVRYVAEEEVRPWQRTAAAVCYFGLVVALSGLASYAHLLLPASPE